MGTYSDFQNLEASEKIGLAAIVAAKRLSGWILFSGSVYKLENFEHSVIQSVQDSGVSYSAASSQGTVTAGKYYLDRENRTLYLRASDSSNPNSRFLICRFYNFFATNPVNAPWDLLAGFDVPWLPMIRETSQFGVEIDNDKSQSGISIEGSGSITFHCDKTYWSDRFDKYFWENGAVWIYSWTRSIPISEAKLIYKGTIQEKTYSQDQVVFQLKDLFNSLRSPIELPQLSELAGTRISGAYSLSLQRQLYGYIDGFRPQNISEAVNGLWLLAGSVTGTTDEFTVDCAGTALKTDLRPGDSVAFEAGSIIGSNPDLKSVAGITSDTTLILSVALTQAERNLISGKSIFVKYTLPKNYQNREWKLAAHSIREPKAEILGISAPNLYRVDSILDFAQGDQVEIKGELTTITAIVGTDKLRLAGGSGIPGDTITRVAITKCKINEIQLEYLRDYTYDATNATLTLETLAEYNVTQTQTLSGSVQYQAGSAQVIGTGTSFTTDLDVNSWIEGPNSSALVEVLAIVSDTELWLKTNPGLGAPVNKANPTYRKTKYFDYNSDVLNCSILGATLDGTPDTRLLATGPDIVRDVLKKAGLTAEIDNASFDDAMPICSQKIGVSFPENHSDRTAPTHRDAINLITRSVLGVVVQDPDFNLGFQLIQPARDPSIQAFIQHDILDYGIKSDASQIVQSVLITYGRNEFDPEIGEEKISEARKTNEISQYITSNENLFELKTALVSQADAERLAARWALMLSKTRNLLSFETKLQGSRVRIGDAISFENDFLFSSSGTIGGARIGFVTAAKKTISGSQLEIDDLSGAFTLCGVICSTGNTFANASDNDLRYSGFITDDFGLIENDPETGWINKIW